MFHIPNLIEFNNAKLPDVEYVLLVQESEENPNVVQTIRFHVPQTKKVEEFLAEDTEYTNKLRETITEIASKVKQYDFYKVKTKTKLVKECNIDKSVFSAAPASTPSE